MMLIVCICQCQASWGGLTLISMGSSQPQSMYSLVASSMSTVACVILSVGYPGNKKTAQESSTDRKEYGEVRRLYNKSAEVNAKKHRVLTY